MADCDDVDIDERTWPTFAKDRGKQYLEESSSDPRKPSGKWSSDLWKRIEELSSEKSVLQERIEKWSTEEFVKYNLSDLWKLIEKLSTKESALRKQLEERSPERGLKLSEKPLSDSCEEFGDWSPDPGSPKMLENVFQAPEMPSFKSAFEELLEGLQKAKLDRAAPMWLFSFVPDLVFLFFEHQEATCETSERWNQESYMLTLNEGNVVDSEHISECKHKVFLSHSGAQKGFVKELCLDLERFDRYPFYDRFPSSLPTGTKFPQLIFEAIKQCQVGVLILSEEFFMRSKWPMLELIAMVKEYETPNSRIKILPVYYGISLNDLQRNKSKLQLLWKEWANDDPRINIEECKKALRTLESMNDLVMDKDMGAVKFREEIVKAICNLTPPETRWDDSHVQGRARICKVIQDKMNEVSSSSRIGVVGLYGVGGIGKTTISKALCNGLSSRLYDNACHIEFGEVNEMEVLKKALKKLTAIDHGVLDEMNDVEEGYSYLKNIVQTEPIFLALDNVQDNYKIIQVARTYLSGSYGVGSMVLVTARTLDVLMKLNLKEDQCMEMPELREEEAISLFSNYSFLSSKITLDERLIKNFTELCLLYKGEGRWYYHPLTLKLLGQYLDPYVGQWGVLLWKIATISEVKDEDEPELDMLSINIAQSKYVFLSHCEGPRGLLQGQYILYDGFGSYEPDVKAHIANDGFESHEPDVEAHIANDGDNNMPMKFFNFLKNARHWEGKGFSLMDIEIYNLASDAIQNDCALRSLLQKVLEAIPCIKDVGVEEASQSTQDQTTIVLGFFNASTDNLEFFFEDGETMAKIVGVGLQHAKATFIPGITIEVQEIEKEEWENIWIGVKSGLDTTCKIMKIALPTMGAPIFEMTSFKKREHEDASDGTSSSSNIGSLQGNVFQVPFLWELSKYFIIGKVIDALCLKSNVDTSSEKSEINIVEDCSKESSGSGTSAMEQVAKEAAREAIVSYLSNLRIGSSHPNNNKKSQEGEGGSGDGNDGGDEFHRQGKLPIDLDVDKFYTTKVKVQLLDGGEFYQEFETDKYPPGLYSKSSPSYQKRQKAKITPFFTLDFCKTMLSRQLHREIRITVGNVIFGLHGMCDSVKSHGYFGWFHDELRVSFAPSVKYIDSVRLQEDFKPEDTEAGKISDKTSEQETTSTNIEKSGQVTVVLGNNNVGHVGFGGGLKKGTSASNQQSNEHTLNSRCIQTEGGFIVKPNPDMQRAWLEYRYHSPSLPVDAARIEDKSYRDELNNMSPLCRMQKTKFSGTWVPDGIIDKGKPKVAEYSFQAARKLREIQRSEIVTTDRSSSTSKFFPVWKIKKATKRKNKSAPVHEWIKSSILQKYEKKLYINHTMSHLVHKEIYNLSQKPTAQQPSWSKDDPLVML